MDNKKESMHMTKMRWMIKVQLLTLVLIVIGALNWGLIGLFDFNLVSFIAQNTLSWFESFLYVLIGISALLHIWSRNYYLPFLGVAAFPCSTLVTKVPDNADTQVKISTKPNINVIYWAADSHKYVSSNPWLAYDEYSNAGVARSDVNGIAVLKFRKPSAYKVAHGLKTLQPHVHYRVCGLPGMMSDVKTIYYMNEDGHK